MKEDGDAASLAAEARAVEQVALSVQARHPLVPPERIAERARAEHRRYASARVRDFVPLLIERALLLEFRTGEQPE